MAYKILSLKGTKYPMASAFYMAYHPSAHALTSIAPVALIIHINMLLYNG